MSKTAPWYIIEMAKTKRRPITEEESQRAALYKRAWLAKKKRERLTGEDAGAALDISAQAFSQYMNGHMPIGFNAAVKLCRYLGVGTSEAKVENLLFKKNASEVDVLVDDDAAELLNELSPERLDEVMAEIISTLSRNQRIRIAQIALSGLSDV